MSAALIAKIAIGTFIGLAGFAIVGSVVDFIRAHVPGRAEFEREHDPY